MPPAGVVAGVVAAAGGVAVVVVVVVVVVVDAVVAALLSWASFPQFLYVHPFHPWCRCLPVLLDESGNVVALSSSEILKQQPFRTKSVNGEILASVCLSVNLATAT